MSNVKKSASSLEKSPKEDVEKLNISRMAIELAKENSMDLNKVYNELAVAMVCQP